MLLFKLNLFLENTHYEYFMNIFWILFSCCLNLKQKKPFIYECYSLFRTPRLPHATTKPMKEKKNPILRDNQFCQHKHWLLMTLTPSVNKTLLHLSSAAAAGISAVGTMHAEGRLFHYSAAV